MSLIDQIVSNANDSTGIKRAGALCSTTDNKFLYIGSNNNGPVSQFSLSPANGSVALIRSVGGFHYILDMKLSPDERFLYIPTLDDNTIECFSRDRDFPVY